MRNWAGPALTKGYFNRPDLNEDEAIFTKAGWFWRGDIGERKENDGWNLIDRLENLVYLPGGEVCN